MPDQTDELGLNSYTELERRKKNRNYNDTVEAVDDLAAGETPRKRVRATDDPDNAADTVVAEDTEVHVVTCDGTNSVDLDTAAAAGKEVTVVHNGGAATPTLAFSDADFVASGPSNMTTAGDTATILNLDGETDGWVILSTEIA